MRLWQKNTLIALAMILMVVFLILVATEISHAGAGSFTITGTTTSATKIVTTAMSSGTPDVPTPYGSSLYMGKYYGSPTLFYTVMKFPSLIDTIRIYGDHQYDSACIYFVGGGMADAATDSVFVALYEIIRPWVTTMNAADTSGVTWDSANMVGDGSGSGTPADWGTNGCENITSDRKAVAEKVGEHDSLVLLDGTTNTDYHDTIYFWISGASIIDTSNCCGFLLKPLVYGGDDGAASRAYIVNVYAGRTPKLTVWYSDKAGTTTLTRRRRAVVQQ